MAEQIISMVVSNHIGVLARANSILSRKRLNIKSLTLSFEGNYENARITILAEGDAQDADLASKFLAKNEDVHFISVYNREDIIEREHLVVKCTNNDNANKTLMELHNKFDFKTLRVHDTSIVIEYIGSRTEVDLFLEYIEGITPKRFSRAGIILVDDKLEEDK